MSYEDLKTTAKALVPPAKGILACDESVHSTARRFKIYDIPHTPENRAAYRDMMFTTPDLNQFISGVILYKETLEQSTLAGEPFPTYLQDLGIIPGIKVDEGYDPIPGSTDETISRGLDGLRERLTKYYELGARFAKWRAVIRIGDGLPTDFAIEGNAHALARYAAYCQEANIVPIVEPDVLLAGDHSLDRCEEVSSRMLNETFTQLDKHGVLLEGILLKPNMVMAGKDCPNQPSVEEVAEATIRTLKRYVPSAVPGIVFLSGGQGATPATAHLAAMNKDASHPWEVSFSYLRALADPAYAVWQGKLENKEEAQKVFYNRAKLLSAARTGTYTKDMEKELAA